MRKWDKIWNDPVWSRVIGSLITAFILAVLSILALWFRSRIIDVDFLGLLDDVHRFLVSNSIFNVSKWIVLVLVIWFSGNTVLERCYRWGCPLSQ